MLHLQQEAYQTHYEQMGRDTGHEAYASSPKQDTGSGA